MSSSELQAVVFQHCEAEDSTFLTVGEAGPSRDCEGNDVGQGS